ncbi:CCA tRNA nucleotidyltransferase [Magnetovibrio sp. PR-2]|uniref:CCA tRNA nucleotidyltransferase n=1 Tax=Magnetovibrio sp. PR-2 TaxID=3120356 RepID=UPI002FCE2E06
MEPTGLIAPQPWMRWPETQAVMNAFHKAGAEARFIGGCVRDAVLRRAAKDIDIATPLEPENVQALLEADGIHVIPTGIQHGTVTAVIGNHHFEITTLRVDVENFGRKARVAFTDDWTQDAARRDFTINAMSCDEDGNVYDPYDGLDDLGKGQVQFVGEPEQRIEEDVLRLLRFFRFNAEYGKPPINGKALRACRKLAHRLPELSGERVRGELFRILTAPHPADTITLMRGEKVIEHILPEAGDVGRLRMLQWLLERAVRFDGVEIDPVRRLAALLDPGLSPAEVEAVAVRLKFSNREKKHLLAMTAPGPTIFETMSESQLRQAHMDVGSDSVVDRGLLAWAAELALVSHLPRDRTERWRSLIETAITTQIPPFPLRGQDVIDLGGLHGPEIGQALNTVKDWWRSQDFRPNREDCLDRLNHVLRT